MFYVLLKRTFFLQLLDIVFRLVASVVLIIFILLIEWSNSVSYWEQDVTFFKYDYIFVSFSRYVSFCLIYFETFRYIYTFGIDISP